LLTRTPTLTPTPARVRFSFGADFCDVERIKKKRLAPRVFEYLIEWAGPYEDGQPWLENWGDIRARFEKACQGEPSVECGHWARSVLIAKTQCRPRTHELDLPEFTAAPVARALLAQAQQVRHPGCTLSPVGERSCWPKLDTVLTSGRQSSRSCSAASSQTLPRPRPRPGVTQPPLLRPDLLRLRAANRGRGARRRKDMHYNNTHSTVGDAHTAPTSRGARVCWMARGEPVTLRAGGRGARERGSVELFLYILCRIVLVCRVCCVLHAACFGACGATSLLEGGGWLLRGAHTHSSQHAPARDVNQHNSTTRAPRAPPSATHAA
jgi:hypothetical protein